MICYKVVSKKSRYGTNLSIYLKLHNKLKRKTLLKMYPKLKDFLPIYYKNKIIKRVEDSPGIMVFNHRYSAENFIIENDLVKVCKIVKVEGINNLQSSPIKESCGSMIFRLIDCNRYNEMIPPHDTLFFEEVKVLE